MNLLEQAKQRIMASGPVPFTYDRGTQAYQFGSHVLTTDDISERGIRKNVHDNTVPAEDGEHLIAEVPVVKIYSAFLTLPSFQRFIRDRWTTDLAEETAEVMREIMPTDGYFDSSDFRATCIDKRLGRVVLGVPGSCACLGPDATTPRWGERYWEIGVMDQTFHNIDRALQRAALLAGLGYLGLRTLEAS